MLDTKKSIGLACCIALALGIASAGAQQSGSSAGKERGDLDRIRKTSTLIGTHVLNRANTTIADIRDLVLSPEGDIQYAILGVGGVAGVGETYLAAPFDVLDVGLDEGKWVVNLEMQPEDLKKAPTLKSDNYNELTDEQWIKSVDQFFSSRTESEAKSAARGDSGAREHRAVKHVLLASKVRGVKPRNKQDESLGKVEDLLFDQHKRVVFVVLGRGGVLGLGENYVPVPWSVLTIRKATDTNDISVMIDATKSQLEKAPVIKGSDYSTLLGRGFADEVRRYFGVTERSEAADKTDSGRR